MTETPPIRLQQASARRQEVSAPARWLRILSIGFCFTLFAAACSETQASGPRISQSGTSELHHLHDGFPHYIGHFKAESIQAVERQTSPIQGIEWLGSETYESRGTTGNSALLRVNGSSGVPEEQLDIDEKYSAAGLTIYGNQLFQLTYEEGEVLVYDLQPLRQVGSYKYEGEGWGLCNSDDEFFVMSNGSSQLTVRALDDFELERRIDVTLDGDALPGLNELECVGDQIWANIADSDDPTRGNTIVGINSNTGEVEATIDASDIVPKNLQDTEGTALNGIAVNPEDASLWLTGKRWPAIHKVKLVPVEVG